MTDENPPIRVFCLPYAGGSSVAYRGWPAFARDLDVMPCDYPGHLLRPDEPLARTLPDLVAGVIEETSTWWTRGPFALCGTSLGALVAFEVARVAEAAGTPPAALIVCACAAPSRLPTRSPITETDDAAFLATVAERYGRSPVPADDAELTAMLLPILRADIAAFDSYVGTGSRLVSCDIVALTGENDRSLSFADVAAWRTHSTGTTTVRVLPGDHFFIESELPAVATELRSALCTQPRLPGPRGTGSRDGDPARCPVTRFPIERRDPFALPPEYAALRERGPVVRAELTIDDCKDVWLVTRFREAQQVLGDTRFSSDARHPGFPVRRTPSALIRMDPPEHTKYRHMLAGEFSPGEIARLRPTIEHLTDDLLDAVAMAGSPTDLMPSLARPLPSMVICQILGVPREDHQFLQDRSAVALSATSTPEEIDQSVADLGSYMDRVIRGKIDSPGDDVLTRMLVRRVRSGECSLETASDLARLLLVAGHVTTVNMIGLSLLVLITQPQLRAELRATPAMTGRAVTELLRSLSITATVSRVATADIEIGGTMIRNGDAVMVSLSSANHDDRRFDRPEQIDIHRSERSNLALGWGPHLCLGASLARLELEVMLGSVLRRFPSLRLAVPFEDIPFRRKVKFYGVHELPVAWDE